MELTFIAMVKASRPGGSGKKYISISFSKGFRLSRSRSYRIIIQQLLHSGSRAWIGIKVKKRRNKKVRSKLLNFFLNTKGTCYSRFKTKQKIKAQVIDPPTMLTLLMDRRHLVRILIEYKI